MLVLGLTGGIGCGKSTVSHQLATLGARVLDGDRIARAVVQPGEPGLQRIVDRFGAAMLQADGQLDRPRLGQLIFADAHARRDLNALLHPLIVERLRAGIAAARAEDVGVCVLDVPLLLEIPGIADACDAVWTVECAPETQVQRIVLRNGLRPDEAQARIAAQWPAERRKAAATAVLDNDGTLAELHTRILQLWQALTA
jgi:dephospho-CoA kinase